ncbi:hypothetical protein [uncultured Erythrobacter sp.]|uniref:hypothetical protein n=1 Tax=uncultured Erythrobacter sp. TaxID=263913 RepID=UPI00261EDCC8|nr:hypothetical protein [uncultured Erythrobacter sp.]
MSPELMAARCGVDATRRIGGKLTRDVLLPVLALLAVPELGAFPVGMMPPQPASASAPARIGKT